MSAYNFLSGASEPEEMVARAAALGVETLALLAVATIAAGPAVRVERVDAEVA